VVEKSTHRGNHEFLDEKCPKTNASKAIACRYHNVDSLIFELPHKQKHVGTVNRPTNVSIPNYHYRD
jgi:hypothetical protein